MKQSFLVISALLLTGCQAVFDIESDTVYTPIHDDTRVFYLKDLDDSTAKTVFELVRPYQLDQEDDYLVENGDPVSIAVNRVILPRHFFSTTPDDDRDSNTYDIAVVLDIAAVENQDEQSIAVFYQRGVRANTALAFENLLVYSQDSWDNRVPPYFRIRIFSVANERNERARELLDQVSQQTAVLSNLAGTPSSEPFLQVASRAAELVVQGNNEMLVDFQFQLYSVAQASESGGMPLGLFRKGGLLVAGVPRGEERQYWSGRAFSYDMDGEQMLLSNGENAGDPIDAPILLATVITTETVVPNVVKRRSAEIFEILSNQEALQFDFERVTTAIDRLDVAVSALRARETFATNPTVDNLRSYIAVVAGSTVGDGSREISMSLNNWLLATIREATGVRLSNGRDYREWMELCSDKFQFDDEQRRFVGVQDATDGCQNGSILDLDN